MKNKIVDRHTLAAASVAEYTYCKVVEFSSNENPGLLVGTVIKKVTEPSATPSKYWKGLYWTASFVCPNSEVRKVCCDVLIPSNEESFRRQQSVFEQVVV